MENKNIGISFGLIANFRGWQIVFIEFGWLYISFGLWRKASKSSKSLIEISIK